MPNRLVDFTFSVEDWIAAFRIVFEAVAGFFKELFGVDLFKLIQNN
ncbi:MAG: hypothetical protein IJT27_02775 [Clostridia bacterium]|nr:hypothetical protein [Clostridia bacterium]